MSDNKKNREELKNYFRKGNVPTEEHFALLIDSVVNIVDDKPLFATDMPENESLKEDNTEERIKPEQASETSLDAYLTIPADGDWYQLPVESAVDKEIDGCRIYRVYASCYNKREDSYDMCVATASHCSGNDRKILSPQNIGGDGRETSRYVGIIKMTNYFCKCEVKEIKRSEGHSVSNRENLELHK